MSRPRQRVRLEDGLKLDLNKLIRQKLVRPGSKTGTGIRWSYRYLDEEITTGKITADMTYARRGWLRLQFGNLDQWIDLETVPRHRLPANRAACLGALETSRLAILRQSPGMGAASRLWLAILNASGPGALGRTGLSLQARGAGLHLDRRRHATET